MASEAILKQKQGIVEEIKDKVQNAKTIVLFDYRGLTDSEIKELRRKLRIREGDPLEIYTNNDQMVLKKYSPMASLSENAKSVADGIYGVNGKLCIVTDRNHVLSISKGKLKELVGKEITLGIDKILRDRKVVKSSVAEGQTIVPIVHGVENEMQITSQIIVPIIANGDVYGSVILVDGNQNFIFSKQDENLATLGASFLSSQLEE